MYTAYMTTMTIPKTFLHAKDDLILISRKEYENLSARPPVREFTPSKALLRKLAKARRDFRAGKTISLAQLKRELANRD